jgi:hypothetical protein
MWRVSTRSKSELETHLRTVSYSDMLKLCTHYFGQPRSGSGSHNAIFKMPWQGDPRINLQNKNGKAKPYQVKQAIAAIDRSKEK